MMMDEQPKGTVSFKVVVPFEPYRMKVVEPIPLTTWEERLEIIQNMGYNPLKLEARHITIDFLTDSGVNGMSSKQLAALVSGDESYGVSTSYTRFIEKVRTMTGFQHVIPTHQGRAAEHLLFKALLSDGNVCYGNGFFDSTRTNIQRNNCTTEVLSVQFTEQCAENFFGLFRGNIDCAALEKKLETLENKCGLVLTTLTNNSHYGQPVSMQNIKETSEICKKHKVPFFADACRFAENAWFIKENEKDYSDKTIEAIVLEMFKYFDGCYVSAKKDGICNVGGFLATSNDEVYNKCRLLKIPVEGGVAGRDYEAMVVGFTEVLEETYLSHRINNVREFSKMLNERKIPVKAVGGHALYIDAEKLFPHLTREDYPAWTLSCELYLQGGIRCVESGNLIRGYTGGKETFNNEDLIRLAIPRRVYTLSHFRYVADVLCKIKEEGTAVKGLKIVHSEDTMRAFTLIMEPKYQVKNMLL